MAKPYEFDPENPIITKESMRHVAGVIDNNYVKKSEGSGLITDAQLAQINTNKTDIASLKTNKVDKVSGKDLVSTTDITQITTNKTDIATLKTQIASINQILEGLDTTLAQIASELEALA